jgi:hypothetical protein
MDIKLMIELDTDEDLSTQELKLVQAEMYICCHNIEQHRFGLISCRPLNVNGEDRRDIMS